MFCSIGGPTSSCVYLEFQKKSKDNSAFVNDLGRDTFNAFVVETESKRHRSQSIDSDFSNELPNALCFVAFI